MDNIKQTNIIDSFKLTVEKQFFRDLLDKAVQDRLEREKLENTLKILLEERKSLITSKIEEYEEKIEKIKKERDFAAEQYIKSANLTDLILKGKQLIAHYDSLCSQPYFARMDLADNLGQYSSIYIGKRGDRKLGIADWRAPVSKRYYQKSNLNFDFNNFSYKVILRRGFDIYDGVLRNWQDEYLNLQNYLSKELLYESEQAVVFDPFLKEILQKRKKSKHLFDIIETIQEKQYEIITQDMGQDIIIQGCAGSGKTMVMLHRLSHIMYNNPKIKPEHILVLTPSVSFNRFIDKLCAILEIEKVKTVTVDGYFAKLLKERQINFAAKISTISPPQDYTDYIYSAKFVDYARLEIEKITDGVKDYFTCDEFAAIKGALLTSFQNQQREYKKLKNSPKHIIKAALGEIKLSKERGVYFTREFRKVMSEAQVVNDFLSQDLQSENFNSPYYFYKQFVEFFESFKYLSKNLDKVFNVTIDDLNIAKKEIEEKVASYKRHSNIPAMAVKIAQFNKLILEYKSAKESVKDIYENFSGIYDLFETVKKSKVFLHFGNAQKDEGLAKFLYNQIIKPIKTKFKLPQKMYSSDLYAIACLLNLFGLDLRLGQSYIFIDEGQDLSLSEYRLITSVNDSASFNVFGDVGQNISGSRGIDDWQDLKIDAKLFVLSQNYRNTNQIVKFVKDKLDISMHPIGVDGQEVLKIDIGKWQDFFENRDGISAIIASEDVLKKLYKQGGESFNLVGKTNKIAANKINLLTVVNCKGLEFSTVLVCDKTFTKSQKYIAYTRALNALAIAKGELN